MSSKKEPKNLNSKNTLIKEKPVDFINTTSKYGKSAPKKITNEIKINIIPKKETPSASISKENKQQESSTNNTSTPNNIVPSVKIAKIVENIKAKEKKKEKEKERLIKSRNKDYTLNNLGITKSTTSMFSKYSKTNIFKTVTSKRFDISSSKINIVHVYFLLKQEKNLHSLDNNFSIFKEMEKTMDKFNINAIDKNKFIPILNG